MSILDNIERWLTLVGVGLVPVITLIMKIIKDYLEKKKTKQEKEIQQYNFSQHGNHNNMNIQIVNNPEQEKYHKMLNNLEESKQKQAKLENIASKIENLLIKVSVIILICIAVNNLSIRWQTDQNIFENYHNFISALYDAFQSSGKVTIYMMFALSLVLILELLTSRTPKLSIRNIKTWFLILIINVANVLTLNFWKQNTLGKGMNELSEKSNRLADNPNLESFLSYYSPFLIGIQIAAVFFIAGHIVKLIIVPDKEHPANTNQFLLISILSLIGVPFIYLYYLP
ncbi:hypothetical protein [Bacillus paralicheniformis]|uniref:hypothetical protein n=1 Tax=Bacillus paralicheniformis TaxID=1648923 RepID=UPI000CDA9E51|nr:hypothetical protein [Bacillus paralicheniformis]POO77847.1 hypothetical protein C1T30_36140 [Bacillus sp. MBGLi97]